MLKGRLGLDTARVPHIDRHGLTWLARGALYVEDGTLRFRTSGVDELSAGDYAIPFQVVSMILLGPGSTVSHDALRLLARHGTGLVAVGTDGVRFYASMPYGPDDSKLAREQVDAWSDEKGKRLDVARRMYAWRLGEILPHSEIAVLRGIEGTRMKTMYRHLAEKYGVKWKGRRYDRADPQSADTANQAINHAATAVQSAAMIAVSATGTVPQLGFIHEHSGRAFALDIADLYRDNIVLPCAFQAVREQERGGRIKLESVARRITGRALIREKVIPSMIDRIKELFDADDRRGDA